MQAPRLTQLYLKEFFGNFSLRQKHGQSVSLLSSSLEVLEQLVRGFAQHRGIPIQEQRQHQESLSATFERLYTNISTIFQAIGTSTVRQRKQEHIDDLFDITVNKLKQPCDDELYEILNDYRNNNKKLKDSLHAQGQKLESKSNELMQMIIGKEKMQKQIRYLQQSIEHLETEVKELVSQVQAKQTTLGIVQAQHTQIRAANTDLQNRIDTLTATIGQLESTNAGLRERCQAIEQQCSEYQGQIKQISESQNELIRSKLGEIPQLVQSKLADEQLLNRSAAQALAKFVKYSLRGRAATALSA